LRRNLALDASMSRSFAAVRRETGWRGASEGCYQKGLWSGRDHPPSSRRWNDASSPVLPGACLVRALLEEDQAHAPNLVLKGCLAVVLYDVLMYQGCRGRVRDLDSLGSYSITQELPPAMLGYHLLPYLLEAIQAIRWTHGGREPPYLLRRTSGIIDVE
jgi:hypothetical protein